MVCVTIETSQNVQNFKKFQNAQKVMKLKMVVDCQVCMRLLELEFPKWPPLPWKLQKCQIFSKCSKLNETWYYCQLACIDETFDFRIFKMDAVAMETAEIWNFLQYSNCTENLQKDISQFIDLHSQLSCFEMATT